MIKNTKGAIFLAGIILCVSMEAQAGWFRTFSVGMAHAGFQQQLRQDLLQDGWRYEFGQNFVNRRYDFGNADITFNGNLSGDFSFGQRGIPEARLILNTGPGGLAYDFEYFDGISKVTVDDGFYLINQDLKVNKLGFYDIELQVVNRGTLVSDDQRFNPIPFDYDIGPINVHGHWLIDLINLTLGREFGFVLPGGAADQIVAGWQAAEEGLLKAISQSQALHQSNQPSGELSPVSVPEPISLALFGLGGILILRRRRR